MSVKVQVLSDLHFEILTNRRDILLNIPRRGSILALCGDIGDPLSYEDKRYDDFIMKNSEKFKDVFVVCGNHEFYKNEIIQAKKKVHEICSRHDNVHFLDIFTKTVVENKELGVRFFGTTLWSDILEERRSFIRERINDYHYSRFGEKLLTVEDTVKFHKEELQFLKDEIKKTEQMGMTCCIFTHHSPVWKYDESNSCLIKDAFCNRLEGFIGENSRTIQAWCFGHTHHSNDFKIKGTRLYSNQFGYQDIRERSGYKLDDFIEIISSKRFLDEK